MLLSEYGWWEILCVQSSYALYGGGVSAVGSGMDAWNEASACHSLRNAVKRVVLLSF